MLRLLSRSRIPLILFVLFIAILAPIPIEGYFERYRAQAAFEQKDYSSAAKYYELAARNLPWEPGLWEQAGSAMFHVNEDDSIALFSIARQHDALSAGGWATFGRVYWVTSRDQQALDIWLAGLNEYPSYKQFYYLISLAYRGLGNFPAEQKWLDEWIATGKAQAPEHYELAELDMTIEPERAIQELKTASSMDPSFGPAAQTLTATLNAAALERDPAGRLVVIGRGLGLVNEWPLSADAFQQAVKADGSNAEAWAWLGEAQQHVRGTGKMELDKALSLDPQDAVVRALRGLYWKRQQNYPAALAEYVQAVHLEPENPAWQTSVGEAYTLMGDLVSALAAYQEATTLAPNDATYWRMLAMFCADNGVQALDVGLPAAKKAAQIAPEDPQALDALGWSYLNAGYPYNAEQTLLKAIQAAPDFALAHVHLAETYLRKGDNASARAQLNLARQLDPDGPTGQLASALLQQYFP